MQQPKHIGALLPAALAPAPLATRPSATTDEESTFALARREQTLAVQGEEALKVALKTVFSRVGLRAKDIPNGPEKVLLHRDILKHYGQHTPAEIELAFEMAITDQLDLTPKEVRVYDQFTFAYFAYIMNGYRRWATALAKQRETKEPPPEPPKPTPAQMVLINLDYACARAWMHQHELKLPLSKIPR